MKVGNKVAPIEQFEDKKKLNSNDFKFKILEKLAAYLSNLKHAAYFLERIALNIEAITELLLILLL